ncbi:hypothetical protein CTM86_07495 [Fusobacterium pseudoperiodonticum]|jgi:hypothetical protein|uniref:Uncharacterized protein n=1 Tax=Fusobacterium pseudoperiodonticum TaxID=2663009 RepID=A0A2D3PQM8_9FUSO|nr:hypothetical protein [Fusobacterium pseudoperiodonticum]ATV66445.1 hypothetical protein CTM86_07495 [Fusobacterium pseudoperiodonticum]ATV67852.1 hypothetical protein CTM92_03980 [Fusobacterium pseudoperiodonticum]ATV69989.1 hypothetical protein CTM98_04600 [Fusobacterium pseudoperiodonticum]MBS5870571.1 hypothetical protein [Fusobacterium periodonticum]
MNSIEELKNKTKIEAEELRKKKNSGLKKEITPIFLSEEKKELFKKEVLELVSIGNIVKLQNIIKEDFWDTSIMLQNNKWVVLYDLMNEEYINKWTIISSYPIVEISNIKEFYNILESVPTITSKGIDELNRLKKKYGE